VSPERLFDDRPMTSQYVFQRFAQIAYQMETVCDLHCVWRTQTSSFGVGTCTVAADHFRRGVIA